MTNEKLVYQFQIRWLIAYIGKFEIMKFSFFSFGGQPNDDRCYLNHASLGTLPTKKTGFFGNFPKGGGGSSQFPKLLQINQVIFGMPKLFLGAKTCFTIVGR